MGRNGVGLLLRRGMDFGCAYIPILQEHHSLPFLMATTRLGDTSQPALFQQQPGGKMLSTGIHSGIQFVGLAVVQLGTCIA